MILTKDFKFLFYRLLIAGVALQAVNITLQIIGVKDYLFIFDFLKFAPSFLFWMAVAYITTNQQRALISFFIQNGLAIIGIFYAGLYDSQYSSIVVQFVAPVCAFLFFGFDYFKNHNGLWLGVFGLMISGNNFYGYSYLGEFWDNFLQMAEMRGILSYYGETIYINYVDSIFNSFSLITQFGFFWILLNYMNSFKNHNYDFSFRKLIHFEIKDKLTFSLIYWMFRIVIGGLIFGSVQNIHLYFVYEEKESLYFFFSIIPILAKIYIVCSLYRNFLVSYFIERNHYPSWFYYVLNIPILNLIAWIIFMIQTKESIKIGSTDVLDEIEENKTNRVDEEVLIKLKNKFVAKGKNKGIKTLIYVAVSLNFLILLIAMMNYNVTEIFMLVGIMLIVSLAFVILYLNNPKGLYIVLGIYFIIVFIYVLFQIEALREVVSFYSIISLIIYYPLFHFDQFSYIDKVEENIETNLSEE